MPTRLLVAILCFSLLPPAMFAADPEEVTLVSRGNDPLPIVVSKSASPEVRKSAETLASYLGKISGAKFSVVDDEESKGIRVGRLSDFPHARIWASRPLGKRTIPRGERIIGFNLTQRDWMSIGTTDLAVEHAVWDLLYRLGYRQFFPGKNWEVIPKRSTLSIAVEVHEHPDYYARRIWYGFGPWDYAAKPYQEWCAPQSLHEWDPS